MKYFRRPPEVDAVQFTGGNVGAIELFAEQMGIRDHLVVNDPEVTILACTSVYREAGCICRSSSQVEVQPGDWVAVTQDGDTLVMHDLDFQRQYQASVRQEG